jgi:hypothetical protein
MEYVEGVSLRAIMRDKQPVETEKALDIACQICEALIYMLCQAAELEHGIMVQYLFAAFSLKQHADEGLAPEELETVTRWRRTIAHVATEEMLHLALVQNVLCAIGAAPHLTRPNLPSPAHHYPAGVNLTLVTFGERALQHFMFLERPEGMALEGATGIDAPVHEAVPLMADGDIVPQLQDFATVGHLYRSIEHGLARLAEKFGEQNLFVGPPRAQATSTDFQWPELVAVPDLASAQRALDTILEQGEGARGHWRRPTSASSSRSSTSTADAGGESGVRPGPAGAVREGAPRRARRVDSAIGDRVTVRHGPLQRQLRDPVATAGALLRAHGGDRRAACDPGERGGHAEAECPSARDLITTLPVGPGGWAHGRTELRALLRGRRPPASPELPAPFEARARCLEFLREPGQRAGGRSERAAPVQRALTAGGLARAALPIGARRAASKQVQPQAQRGRADASTTTSSRCFARATAMRCASPSTSGRSTTSPRTPTRSSPG